MKIIGGAGNASTQWIGSKPLNSKKLLLSQPQVLGSQVLKACCGIGKPKRTQTKKMLKIHRTSPSCGGPTKLARAAQSIQIAHRVMQL